jgi:hypothetical protein
MSRFARADANIDLTEALPYISEAIGRSRSTGLDPAAYAGLIGAAFALGGTGGRIEALAALRLIRPFTRWRNDGELLDFILEIELIIRARLGILTAMAAQFEADRAHALELMEHASSYQRGRLILRDCNAALAILQPAIDRLRYALSRVAAVPTDLGERYEAAYNTLQRGHVLPHDGRFITGEDLPASLTTPEGNQR